jgi:ATP-dependent Clp protease ATP-binding subunit ClpA
MCGRIAVVTDDADRFSPAAGRALELAEAEAAELGHGRVGTEHLLLGILEGDDVAGHALRAAGATLAAARSKVREAVGGQRSLAPRAPGRPERTARAARAIARAERLSHQARSEVVETAHLLLGVLDVEGTAGQVLRGLGVDVGALREAFDDRRATVVSSSASATTARCASCGAELDDHLAVQTVEARGERGEVRKALVFSCDACGAAVGASHA